MCIQSLLGGLVRVKDGVVSARMYELSGPARAGRGTPGKKLQTFTPYANLSPCVALCAVFSKILAKPYT